MKNFFSLLILASFSIFASCGDTTPAVQEETTTTEVEVEEVQTPELQTIVGVAAGNQNFSTLVAAVKAAGLVDVLNSDGPFTVFAPVNAAFEKLPEGTVETLLKPENKATLTGILTYHVVAGKFAAGDVVAAINKNNGSFTVPTVQGGNLTATLNDGSVILTDAAGNTSTVVMADVEASNGVVHAIDSVVMPN